MPLEHVSLIILINISFLPVNVSSFRMNDNHMRFQTSFSLSFIHTEVNRTREILVFATFEFSVVIQGRSVFVNLTASYTLTAIITWKQYVQSMINNNDFRISTGQTKYFLNFVELLSGTLFSKKSFPVYGQ